MAGKQIKNLIYARHDGVCFYCGDQTWQPPWRPGCAPRKNASLDHVQTQSQGGKWEPDNLVLACEDCNNERGEMDALEFFNLKTKGQDPDVVLRRLKAVEEKWNA